MSEQNNPKTFEPQIDKTKVFELEPTDVLINGERPRQRKDLGHIKELVASIEKFGQLQPIVITRTNELIAGGRRLAACTLGGFKVKAIYSDELDPVVLREIELEENLQRKDLTPAEQVLATSELVNLKRKLYGTPTRGIEGGFTLDDAAELIGKTRGSIIEDLQLAEAIKAFPDLAACKTKSEIKSAMKGMERIQNNIDALTKHEELIKTVAEFTLVSDDALKHMLTVTDKSIDLLFTDPPYGINIHDLAMSIGGHTGSELTTTGIKYDDSPENALAIYEVLAKESFRFCKDTAHALIFCGPSHFWAIKNMFNAAGWKCSERPIIWIKQASGQSNNPSAWFSAAYEMLLFARKMESKLVLFGKPDWVQCNIVPSDQRVHQAEKPVALCKELISRVAMPGSIMYDPFMGGGALIEAAVDMKLFATGCEIGAEAYAAAVSRMSKWNEANKK